MVTLLPFCGIFVKKITISAIKNISSLEVVKRNVPSIRLIYVYSLAPHTADRMLLKTVVSYLSTHFATRLLIDIEESHSYHHVCVSADIGRALI